MGSSLQIAADDAVPELAPISDNSRRALVDDILKEVSQHHEKYRLKEDELVHRLCHVVNICSGLDPSQALSLLQAGFNAWKHQRVPLNVHGSSVVGKECGLLFYPEAPLVNEKPGVAPIHDRVPGACFERVWIEQNLANTAQRAVGWGHNTSEAHNLVSYGFASLSYEPCIGDVLVDELNSGWWNKIQAIAGTPQRTTTCMAPIAEPVPLTMGGYDLAVGMNRGLAYPTVSGAIIRIHWSEPVLSVFQLQTDSIKSNLPFTTLSWLEPCLLANVISKDDLLNGTTSIITPAAMDLENWISTIVDIAECKVVPVSPATGQKGERMEQTTGLDNWSGDNQSFVRCFKSHCSEMQCILEQLNSAVITRKQRAEEYSKAGLKWSPWMWLGYERLHEASAVSHLARMASCLGLTWKTALPNIDDVGRDLDDIHEFVRGENDWTGLASLATMDLIDESLAEQMEIMLHSGGVGNSAIMSCSADREGVRAKWHFLSRFASQASVQDGLQYQWPHISREMVAVVLSGLKKTNRRNTKTDRSWARNIDVGKSMNQRANSPAGEPYFCFYKAPSMGWIRYFDPDLEEKGELVCRSAGKIVMRVPSSRAAGTIQGMVSVIRCIFSLRLRERTDNLIEHNLCLRTCESLTQSIAVICDGTPLSALRRKVREGLSTAQRGSFLEMISCLVPVRESRRNNVEFLTDWLIFSLMLAGPIEAEGEFDCWKPLRAFVLKTSSLAVFHPQTCQGTTQATEALLRRFSVRVILDEPLSVPVEIPRFWKGSTLALPLTPWLCLNMECTQSRSANGSPLLHIVSDQIAAMNGPVSHVFDWEASGLGKPLQLGGSGFSRSRAVSDSSSQVSPVQTSVPTAANVTAQTQQVPQPRQPPPGLLAWYRNQLNAQEGDARERHRKVGAKSVIESSTAMAKRHELLFSPTEDRNGITVASSSNVPMNTLDELKKFEIKVLGNGAAVERFDKKPMTSGAICRNLNQLSHVIEKLGHFRGRDGRKIRLAIQYLATLVTLDTVLMQETPVSFSSDDKEEDENAFVVNGILRLPPKLGRMVVELGSTSLRGNLNSWPTTAGDVGGNANREIFMVLLDSSQAMGISVGTRKSETVPEDSPTICKLMAILPEKEQLYTGGVPAGAFVKGTTDWVLDPKLSYGQ